MDAMIAAIEAYTKYTLDITSSDAMRLAIAAFLRMEEQSIDPTKSGRHSDYYVKDWLDHRACELEQHL